MGSAMSIDAWNRDDPLGQALQFLRMSGVVYCCSEFTAPWGLALPPMPDCLMFHAVTSGRCWLHGLDGEAPRELERGDFALLPHGTGHVLSSSPDDPGTPLFDLEREQLSESFEVLRHGGGGRAMSTICGAVRFDDPAARLLLAALPALVLVPAAQSAGSEWFQPLLGLMAAEARQPRAGSEAVITRVADILVVQAVRSWMDTQPGAGEGAAARTGWLHALRDRQIGRAIVLMHRSPQQPWTLASLGAEVGLSRSAFASRFSALVGLPPLEYLTQWRMRVAQARLRERDEGLATLAARVGYQSEAAFSRAFKRVTGMTPGSLQRDTTPAAGWPAAAAS